MQTNVDLERFHELAELINSAGEHILDEVADIRAELELMAKGA